MGLLDSLLSSSQGGYGGLLDSLLYPTTQRPAQEQPQYDVMGNSTGFSTGGPTDPFPLAPARAGMFQPPPSIFNSGTSPFATTASFAPQAPQAPQLPPAQTIAPAPQVAAPQDMPTATLPVGDYKMPQFGTAPQQQAQQPSATDFSAQSRQPEQSQQLPPAFGGGGYMDRVANGGGLISSMFGDSGQQQNLSAQYNAIRQALETNGDSKQAAASKAMVAVMNPEAAKTIIPELFTSKTEIKMVKDALGQEHPYSWNPRDQTFKPVGENGEGSATGPQGVSLLAPGVKFDSSKSGEEYLNQFGPEVKAAVKAYINGDVMPTGNPRLQVISSKAKEIAQKYGQDTGIPVSDALYSEKRKYRTELGTNSPNSAGGQAKAFNQGISHMVALADNLEKLDNSNGMGVPMIAQGVNAVRQGVSTSQSAIADEAKALGQTVAGEVGKLFSGSAGGGVHERELTRDRFDTVKSKPQLAAALRATLETMQGGLQALEQRRDSVLGPNSGVELVGEATRQNIAKIQGAIDRLEGKATANTTKNGVSWSIVK